MIKKTRERLLFVVLSAWVWAGFGAQAAAPQDFSAERADREGKPGWELKREGILPLEKLRSEIAGLKVEDTDWRKVEWETSLVRGLKRSQAEKKLVILWVFIDRPVDDKRC